MVKYFFISFLFTSLPIFSQNWIDVTDTYIKNSDFEDTVFCPITAAQTNACIGWYPPTMGTSDYFNVCNNAINGNMGVPNSIFVGYQQPFSGKGYMGLLAYSVTFGMWSEYIQTELITPLQKNYYYKFSMRVNRADGYNLGVKKMGAHFSNDPMLNSSPKPYILSPIILNDTLLADTLNWQLIEGVFKANNDQKYLTIGWFGGDTITDDMTFVNPPIIDPATGDSIYMGDAYYVIDSLKLSEVASIDYNINLPNVITNNADGINDTYNYTNKWILEFDYAIMNRWGNLIYENSDKTIYWDGKNLNGVSLNEGVYFIRVKAKTIFDEELILHQFITVIN